MRYPPKQLALAFYELLAEKPTAHKQVIAHFATFLQKIGAAKMLGDIERHFEIIRLNKENKIKVVMETTGKNQPIFPSKVGGKKTELSWQTDPSIIAGAIIKIGDTRIDNSIARRLSEFKKILSF